MTRVKAFFWTLKTTWNISKGTILLWFSISAVLAILPAVALRFNRETLSILSGFLAGAGGYTYADVVAPIVALGALLTAIGLSSRINMDLLFSMMYDAFAAGMYELTMANIHRMDMTELIKKEVFDEWHHCVYYPVSLVDFTSGLCAISAKIISLVALFAVALSVSWIAFTVSAVYVIGVFILNFAITKQTRFDQEVEYWNYRRLRYYEEISENPGMAKEVRVFENTDEFADQWRSIYNRSFDSHVSWSKGAALRDFIGGAGFYIFLITVVVTSVFGVANGTMQTDVFLVLFTLCLNIYGTINGLGSIITRFDRALYACGRQGAFFLRVPTVDSDETSKHSVPADIETVFKTDRLCFSYSEDSSPVLRDVNLTVKRGEIIALVGENGSGKTTLVKLLLNLYRPTDGSVQFFGRPYNDYTHSFIRGKIGVFFQDFFLFHQTLRENVGFGGIEDMGDETRIWDALKKGGGIPVANKLRRGLDTLLKKSLDKSGIDLSGGEKQRVGVSRAHMNNRDILIFDEPASMLDPIAEMEQFNNIKNLLDGRTAILISHRVGFARMADRIIMLQNGEIAETGTHDELTELGGLYAHFFNEQAQWYETVSTSGEASENG